MGDVLAIVEDDERPVEDVTVDAEDVEVDVVEDVAPKTVMKGKILLLSLMFVIKKQMFVIQTSLFLKMAVPGPFNEKWWYTHVRHTACPQSELCTQFGHQPAPLSTVSINHDMKSRP